MYPSAVKQNEREAEDGEQGGEEKQGGEQLRSSHEHVDQVEYSEQCQCGLQTRRAARILCR